MLCFPDSKGSISGEALCLDNINTQMSSGQLIAIVGAVGSGKTCLLNLILGELKLFSGKLQVSGVVSYASQEPWLFAGVDHIMKPSTRGYFLGFKAQYGKTLYLERSSTRTST